MTPDGVGPVRAGRRTVRTHRPDKVLFPGDGDGAAKEYTEADLVDCYRSVACSRSVAPYLLPLLRGRPLMLERHPDGLGGPRFMQKNTPDHYPDWIERAEVAKEDGTVTHVVCGDTATLVYLADQACLTLHRRLSRTTAPDRPDRLVIDLGPPGTDFAPVREAARWAGDLLDRLGLPTAPMTTGSRALHLVVALNGRHGVDEVHAFARDLADLLAAEHPGRLTTAVRKDERGDRLFLDTGRHAYAQTAVAPYTVRARPGAPVAVPITWDQLADPALDARRWTVADAVDQDRSTPWADIPARGRSLGPARRRLDALRSGTG
ncbi:ATP-dependent DNA ligase [Streptomyces sp. NPDC086777]|uniref:DNA polymerase domain-containing protein n=1 Tax=Streptomyces sp. NPDC086777 TaxID=3154866 RepID=UPI00344EBDF7